MAKFTVSMFQWFIWYILFSIVLAWREYGEMYKSIYIRQHTFSETSIYVMLVARHHVPSTLKQCMLIYGNLFICQGFLPCILSSSPACGWHMLTLKCRGECELLLKWRFEGDAEDKQLNMKSKGWSKIHCENGRMKLALSLFHLQSSLLSRLRKIEKFDMQKVTQLWVICTIKADCFKKNSKSCLRQIPCHDLYLIFKRVFWTTNPVLFSVRTMEKMEGKTINSPEKLCSCPHIIYVLFS